MSEIEATIRRAMVDGDVQAINLFRNKNGEFQANIGSRETGSYAIARSKDPVKAMAAVLAKVETVDQFEDLLG